MRHLSPRKPPGFPGPLLALTLFAATAGAQAGAAQTVTGSWTLTYETPRGQTELKLVLEQEASAVRGTAQTRMGEAPVEGTVEGAEVVLVVKMSPPRGDRVLEMRFTGTLKGDVIEGTLTPPDRRRGPRGGGGAPPEVPFKAVRTG